MSSLVSKNHGTVQSALPRDIFQDLILPDLLSQHLHVLLVDPDPPEWHAFYVLPLVSRPWYYTCQSLFSAIFGIKRRSDGRRTQDVEELKDSDGFSDPDDYDPSVALDYAMSMWKRARNPVSKTAYAHQHNRSTLLADKTLIRAYTCLALGRMFLNADVLLPLGAFSSTTQNDEYVRRNAWDEDYDEEIEGQAQNTSMDEASIHRCLMPLECAQRLCDLIRPKRLVHTAAKYMAQVLPLYYTLPLLTKHTQDLQFNVDRLYKFDLEDYAKWVSNTLRRLEEIEEFLKLMMKSGFLVRSFWAESGIPTESLKLTGIINALDDVVRAEWGADTISIRKRASGLIRRWTTAMT